VLALVLLDERGHFVRQ